MPSFDKEHALNAGLISEGDDQDASTREALLRALAPRQTNVVGNLADLQRAGGLIATGQADTLAAGVVPPPGTTSEGLAAEAAATDEASAVVADAASKISDVQGSGDDSADKAKSASDKK